MRHKSFGDIKAREHYHFTGEFLGAAHQYCNLIRKKKFKIPIYAHNFSGYDSHFLMQAIANSEHYLPKLRVMTFNSQKIKSPSLSDYAHGAKILKEFKCKNMLELLELMSSYIRSYISI